MSEVARTIKGRPYERDVAHAVYDDTLVLRSVFGYTTKVRLDDMIPVQVRHLAVGLYPYLSSRSMARHGRTRKRADLVFGVFGEVIERTDVEHELAALRELAEARPEADKVGARDGDAEAHRRLRDIKDAVLVQPETIRLVLTVDEVHEVLALFWDASTSLRAPGARNEGTHNVVRELGEDSLALVFGERSHCRGR
jgi:hypothetical protein